METCVAKIAVSAATYWTDRPYDYNVPPAFADAVKPGVRVIVPFSRGNRKCEGIVLSLAETSEYDKLKPIAAVLDDGPILTPVQLKLALWMRGRFYCTVYEAVKAILPAGLWYDISARVTLCEGYDREQAYEAAGRSKAQCRVLDVLFANGGGCERSVIERAFGEDDPANALSVLAKRGVIRLEMREKRKAGDKTRTFAVLAVSPEDALTEAAAKKRRAPTQAAVLELLASAGRVSVEEIKYFTGCTIQPVRALEKAGFLTLEQEEVYRHKVTYDGELLPLPELTTAQKTAYTGLLRLANEPEARCGLLFGVTGSGKTTVYLHLIDEMLRQGKSSILLVPEIALTPQMLHTFSSHFGEKIAVLHSSLSITERYDEWKRVKNGKARVVIGTRSAIFAPVEDLGIIILDEEQEDTYKSESAPRYHAREVAKFLCAQHKTLLLLGSATPCLESRYAAETGKYSFFSLPGRYNEQALPPVSIVDMKRELRRGNGGEISGFLREELQVNLDRGEQSILFLNRRGASKLIACGECGYTYRCPNCSANMTYHSANGRVMCHYCGHAQRVDMTCPECGGILKFTGAGTQKIEEELGELFPGTQILRMDTDTVAPAGSHEALLNRFREEKIPIMIGTQMVTKGLDFENVTLVGVLSADQSLYTGNFRSGERTFSLITQVVGRCGRGEKAGRAVIQTFTPDNEIIRQAAGQDYEAFYRGELEMRQLQNDPPFTDMTVITAAGSNEATTLRCASEIRDRLQSRFRREPGMTVIGPAPYAVVRVNNKFRYRVTLLGRDSKAVRQTVADLLCDCNTRKEFKGVSVFADANPID
ncbi:MAG: primosomal protein N' [Oscillospiraceae bacterium]|jgi:primosomal protein N' (replication factor Y)|nr:primosomal protein N' [Oscillospiraceae bacterium]